MNPRKLVGLINEELNQLELDPESKGKLDVAIELQKELLNAKNRVVEIERELNIAIEEYNFALGMAVRKRLPQVGVDFSNGKCSIKYKSANLSCHPNLNNRTWSFDPNQHGKKFARQHGPILRLNNELEPLVDAIISYLTGKYRSLS